MRKHPPKVFSTFALLIALMLVFSACGTDQPSVLVAPGADDAVIVDEEVIVDDEEIVEEEAVVEEPVIDEPVAQDGGYVGVTDAQAGLLSAAALLDYNFQGVTDEISGEIEEVYVDATTGRVPYVQLEYGGFLDIGDTELLVPMSAFSWGAGGELILNADEAMLASYPQVDDTWPDLTDPTWDDQLNEYWGTAGYDPGVNFDETTNTVVPVSDLVGFGVSDLGFGAGSINDMLIDLQQGRARYVLLDYGTGLGTDDVVAVPFSAFAAQRLDTGEISLDVNVDRTMIESAPRIQRSALGSDTMFDNNVFDPLDTYWMDQGFDPGIAAGTGTAGAAVAATGAATPTPAMETGGQAAVGGGIANAEGQLMAASALLDYGFENVDGEVSGEIEDLLIDTRTGRVLFATLEYGGFLDIGDTELPVPLSAFAWGVENDLVLNIPEQTLDDLPDMGTDWVNAEDPTWDDQINQYWGDNGLTPGFDVTAESGPVMWASELINSYGVGDAGFGASSVNNLLIDLGQGRVRYAVVDYGGVGTYGTAYGTELAVVPFNALDMQAVGGEFGFDEGFDQGIIETAPRITDPTILNEGTIFDPTYGDQINTYWEDQGFGADYGFDE